VAGSGSFVQQTAIGWFVLELTGSPGDLGLALAAGGIPSQLLGPCGAAVADPVDLRKLLMVTQALVHTPAIPTTRRSQTWCSETGSSATLGVARAG
jgi:hypothetical protein